MQTTTRSRWGGAARAGLMFAGGLWLGAAGAGAADGKKVTYEDDVLPIFRDNCLKCHNPDKVKGDLDLSSFSAAIKGGGSGATLNAGDPDGSLLLKSVLHTEEPEMPPNGKLTDKDIATLRAWIAGGLLQGQNSKALTANKPAVDLALKGGAVGRPEGPPPMPGALSLDPAVRGAQGTALAAVAHSPWAPVVALGAARQVVLYRTDDLEFAGVLPFPEGLVCDVKFSRNGKLLLASGGRGGHSGVVAVWDIATGQRVITIGDQFDSVLAADISADQQWIALGGPDKVVKIYRTKDGGLEHRIKKHTEWVTAVEFSPDSKWLATGDRNGGVMLWEAESGQEMFALAGHRGAITALTWRGDSALVASASEDGSLRVWKASDGTAVRTVTAHAGGVLAARFGHDGRVASVGRDNKVQLWDASGRSVLSPAFAGDLPNRIAVSDDGGKLVASDWKGRVFVWETKAGKLLGELDANPPPLAERIKHGEARVAAARAAATKAAEALLAADAEAAKAQAEALRLRKAIAAAKAPDAPKADADKLADLQKENAAAAKLVAAATKKASDAKAAATETRARLNQAEASLARWTSIMKERADGKGAAAGSKVTLR